MTRRTVFLPGAAADVRSAVGFYRDVSPRVAEKFLTALKVALATVVDHPHVGRAIDEELFTKPLREFPYSVIYAVTTEAIVVAAVAHHRREPGYWRG